MEWRPIDFQGIIGLNHSVVEQTDHYLQEKETRLSHQIFHMMDGSSSDEDSYLYPTLVSLGVHLKLSEAIERLTRRIRTLKQEDLIKIVGKDGKEFVNKLNGILWEFTEVLEGSVVELFQQVKQTGIDKWSNSLAEAVKSIKDVLVHYIDDLVWLIRRLEVLLRELDTKLGLSKKDWFHWFKREESQLDPALLSHLKESETYLNKQYGDFRSRYEKYTQLMDKVEKNVEKMKRYPVLALMDGHDQDLYINIFRLLKFRELHGNKQDVIAEDTKRGLKNICGVGSAMKLFKSYYRGLKESFFSSSLELKSMDKSDEESIREGVSNVNRKITETKQELQCLLETMSLYREFLLQTQPNPYARARWGFTERPVAPEPPKIRNLLTLIFSAEQLQRWIESFQYVLNHNPCAERPQDKENRQEIDRLLHEMSHPLISKSMMKNCAEQLLKHVQAMDELGSAQFETINFLEGVFLRALRSDWKYQVLNEIPLFQELYRMHQGLIPVVDDPAHSFRMERFFRLFDKIEYWVEKGDANSHVYEIELDMNDMKTYLQDFLASVQRANREKSIDPFLDETIEKFRRQLLQYRYAFNRFFSDITTQSEDESQLRNQFLFVDQYFDSVERLLNELQAEWESESKRMGYRKEQQHESERGYEEEREI